MVIYMMKNGIFFNENHVEWSEFKASLSLNFMSEHIENWNEFRREENLLLVKIGRWIYFLLCYFARATIKSWQRRRSGSTGMADVQENKAKIRDNEYVVTDAC